MPPSLRVVWTSSVSSGLSSRLRTRKAFVSFTPCYLNHYLSIRHKSSVLLNSPRYASSGGWLMALQRILTKHTPASSNYRSVLLRTPRYYEERHTERCLHQFTTRTSLV